MGKPRKPRDLSLAKIIGCMIDVESGFYYPDEARKLAAWLLKAADWLEGREKR